MNPRTPPTPAPAGPTFPVSVLRLWGLLEGDSGPLASVPDGLGVRPNSLSNSLEGDPATDTGARCVDCWGRLPFGLGRLSLRCGGCASRADDDIRQRMADVCADAGGHTSDPWPYFDADPWGDA